jgi:hypothetical protein
LRSLRRRGKGDRPQHADHRRHHHERVHGFSEHRRRAFEGYKDFAVIDASGTYSKMTQEITLARIVQAGVVPIDTAPRCAPRSRRPGTARMRSGGPRRTAPCSRPMRRRPQIVQNLRAYFQKCRFAARSKSRPTACAVGMIPESGPARMQKIAGRNDNERNLEGQANSDQ